MAKSTAPKSAAAKPAKAPKVKPVPDGVHTVMPHLVCAGASNAIEFYKKAFDAIEQFRLPAADGKLIHACIRIGNSAIFLVDEYPQWGSLGPLARNGTSVTLHLSVPNADATTAQAVAAGASLTLPVAEMFWGDRYGVVTDPFGHRWSIATKVKDMTPEDIRKAMPKNMGS